MDSRISKLALLFLLVYWMPQVGGRRLTPIYLLIILFYVLSLKYTIIPHQRVIEVFGVFALGAAVRIINVLNNPQPPIDVYYTSVQGFEHLIQGNNPYAVTYTGPPEVSWPYGSQNVQGYAPMMLLTLGIGYFLSDVRYSILIADLAIAYLLYRFVDDKNYGFLLAILYLLNPFGVLVLKSSWNESILTAFLLAALFLWRKKPSFLSPLFLGLSLGAKQFAVLFAPFLWTKYTKKQILLSILIALGIYLPFLLWSPSDLIYDLFTFFGSYVRYDSKSFIPFFLRIFWSNEVDVPRAARTVISIIQYASSACLILHFSLKSKTEEEIAYHFSLTYFVFLLLAPIANLNYYNVLPPFLAIGAKAVTEREQKTPTSLRKVLSNILGRLKKITHYAISLKTSLKTDLT